MRSTTSRIVASGLCLVSSLILGERGSSAAGVSFRNDVMPVLSKSGCNLGTCHGNARGKGGFQLSLRGQNPSGDYDALTRDWLARRANPTDADQSLLLLKPTMQIAHEGGKRFEATSAEYKVLRDWIAAGMPDDTATATTLVKLNVSPREVFVTPADPTGWHVQITATAEFSDGTPRDVTSAAVYEVAQPIADVSHDGRVTGRSAGETTVLVRFLQHQVAVRIAFLPEQPGFEFSSPTPAGVIDEHVFAKLRKLRINPSPVCEDATFVRRVFLDLLGVLPTATEARQFVADSSPNKRAVLIDSLLERPEFADWWALKWADLLRIEEKTLDRKGVENFHAWLRDAFATNMPLDRMVREIVGARGSTYEVPPANFYRALRTPFERSEAVGQLFLGVRLQCAKCHNHPFDRWTQDDYYGWGSVFARVDYKIIENNRRDNNDQHEFDGEQIVFLSAMGEAKDPRTEKTRAPKFLGAKSKVDPKADPLTELADWLTSADNDLFVRMLANRTWQQVMGRGIVDPVDDFRATNPASNPALLNALADELRLDATRGTTSVKPPFDLRHLLRLILNSRTYQLSSEPNATNRDDESNFSRALVQRHSAEQLLDATSQVLDVPLQFAGYPTGPRAAQIPGVRAVGRRRGSGPSEADRFLILFGKPPRLQSCDCERSDETTLTQTFQLVSGDLVNRMLSNKSNRLDALLRSGQPTAEVVRDLYWTTLTRSPTTDELHETCRYIDSSTNRRSALEDVTWGLLNSHEFLLRR
jgi:Protein of unknown function (DUF1549)/Protein of unknown function (DUF1553)